MQNSRDSSLFRSLAVAFGDGLAFGAGLKLTQRALKAQASATSPPAAPVGLLERLDEVERRLTAAERAPGAPAIAPRAFDQKVLEALTTAVETHIREQATEVESRVTELEDKLTAELKALQQQDHSVASGIQTHLEDLNSHINDQIAALRRRADEDRQAMRSEIVSLHREFAEDVARAVESRAEEIVSRHIALLRAELEYKDDQIAELRDVIFGFAQACRSLTEKPAARSKAEPEQSNIEVLTPRRAGS